MSKKSRIYVPGVLVRPLMQPLEAVSLGLRGRVVDVQVLERGQILWRSGAFQNLILTQGLNNLVTYETSEVASYCAVGTGNTAPAANQAGLVAEVARTSNYLPGAGNCGTTRVTPTKVVHRRTFDFPLGALNGNYSELGFSWTSTPGNNLFSRVLIQSGGVPVTVAVTSSQSLRVVYEIEINFSSAALPFNLNFGGAWGAVTGNAAIQETTSDFNGNYGPLGYVQSSGTKGMNYGAAGQLEPRYSPNVFISDSAAPLAAVGSSNARSGTNSFSKISTPQTYTAGTFYRDFVATFSTTEGNINGIRSIYIGSGSAGGNQHWAALMDAARNKTNTQTLTLTLRKSWAAL